MLEANEYPPGAWSLRELLIIKSLDGSVSTDIHLMTALQPYFNHDFINACLCGVFITNSLHKLVPVQAVRVHFLHAGSCGGMQH